MVERSLRGKVAIVRIGETAYNKHGPFPGSGLRSSMAKPSPAVVLLDNPRRSAAE